MIKKVSVIGTGVIGVGWIVRCLAHNKKVTAFDKDFKLKKKLISEIKRTWPFVKKLFNKNKLNLKNFKFVTSIEEAVKTADFIQECAPENYAQKIKLMNIIGKFARPKAIIASSSFLEITSALKDKLLLSPLPLNGYTACPKDDGNKCNHPTLLDLTFKTGAVFH